MTNPDSALGEASQTPPTGPDEAKANETFFDAGEFSFRRDLEERHYWHLHRRDVVLDAIRRELRESDRPALEIGCGNGFVTTHLNRHGCEVDYSDIHPRGLTIAKERARAELDPALLEERSFTVLDITTRPMPNGYRGALLLDVLEHLPEDQRVLENAANALPIGGYLFLTVPAFDYLWSSWDDIQRHKRRYDQKSIRRVLERSGFEIERISYFFLPLWPAAATVKLLRKCAAPFRRKDRDMGIETQIETASPGWLNRLMLGILSLERRWLHRFDLPFGTSLLVFCRRSDPDGCVRQGDV